MVQIEKETKEELGKESRREVVNSQSGWFISQDHLLSIQMRESSQMFGQKKELKAVDAQRFPGFSLPVLGGCNNADILFFCIHSGAASA